MWFKNLTIYKINKKPFADSESLASKLAEHAFNGCGKFDFSSTGFVAPLHRFNNELVHEVSSFRLVCARTEEKVLPTSVVNEFVAEQVAEIEEQQMRKVGRKERSQIKEDVTQELLPKAFTKSRYQFAYFDPKMEYLIIDASSAKRAEEFTVLLREALGSLEVVPFSATQPAANVMTHWLANNSCPSDFEIQDNCELRDPTEDGGIVRVRNQSLFSDEIETHLQAGKKIVKLGLAFDERFKFVLTDELIIKSVKFLDFIQDQLDEIDDDSDIALFDASFSLMVLEMQQFIPRLMQVLSADDITLAKTA